MPGSRNPIEHDILVVRRKSSKRQYFNVAAKKHPGGPPRDGRAGYTGVSERETTADGFRNIVGLACPETLQDDNQPANTPRGPVLAALPLHPDPTASAACTCYLVNPENLTYETSWTHEEWNDQAVLETDNPVRNDDQFELLVATPAGAVYLLGKGSQAAINLRLEAELWNFLRNGGVAGSVRLTCHPPEDPRIVPVVNVEALYPEPLPVSRGE